MASDSELISRLQSGNLEALGGLFDRHQNLVFRTALAITGDPEAASDLLQDVFLRLYRFANHIDVKRPLEPWLYRMTANLSYTWIKRNHRWLPSIEEVADWLTGAHRNGSQDVQGADDEWQQLEQAMSSLPFPQRVVVVLYYVDDLSLQEISDILDVPVGTVKSRLFYGREVMKKQLGLATNDKLADIHYEFT